MTRPFTQVDVFTTTPYRGNPVAVVLDGAGLTAAQMQRFANWMNLSETTFVLPPADPGADYRVRIFTPATELPFAGHPTLGTCHAWLGAGGTPRTGGVIVQECQAGLVRVRRSADGLAFAAPPVLRDGPLAADLLAQVASALRIDRSAIVDASWADNGPGWIAVLLDSAEAVLAVKPGDTDLNVGLAGPYPAGSPGRVRSPGVLHQGRGHRRGSGHRELQRLAGGVAAAHRPGRRAVRGQPGHGAGPGRPGRHLSRRRRHDLGRRRHRHLRVRPGRPVANHAR